MRDEKGQFIKGHRIGMTGKKVSDETKLKMSLASKGRKLSEEHKEKLRNRKPWKLSEDVKKRMSLGKVGNKNSLGYKHPKEFGEKISAYMKNRVVPKEWGEKISKAKKGKLPYIMTDEIRKNIGDGHRGEKAWNWVKDRTKLKRFNDTAKDRRSSAYRYWRQQVWLRDNFKCKIANPDCYGRLEAHHILGYTDHPELRYDINNGITLCHAHHPRKRDDEAKLSPYFQQLVAEIK